MPYDVVAYESDDSAAQLTEAEEGIFHRMLRRAWMNGSIPSDLKALSLICRTHLTRLKTAWPKLSPLWKPHPSEEGRLINPKQEEQRHWLVEKRNASRSSAEKRWKKHKAKGITDTSALPTQCDGNAPIPIPIPIVNTEKGNKKGERKTASRPTRTQPPDHMEITEAMAVWAIENQITVSLNAETENMLDHFRSIGETRLDWLATWRKWMRNSKKFTGGNGNGRHHESKVEGIARRNAENTQRALDIVRLKTVQGDGGGN